VVHAIAALFTNGLAIKFGKRPLFLAANVIMFASALWGFNATTWPSLLACQIIGSVGVAPYQTLVAATVADLYFSFVLDLTLDTLFIKEADDLLCGQYLRQLVHVQAPSFPAF